MLCHVVRVNPGLGIYHTAGCRNEDAIELIIAVCLIAATNLAFGLSPVVMAWSRNPAELLRRPFHFIIVPALLIFAGTVSVTVEGIRFWTFAEAYAWDVNQVARMLWAYATFLGTMFLVRFLYRGCAIP